MSIDTCGIERNCVWRASRFITSRGKKTRPEDLCVALDAGQPCAKRAKVRAPQPFCEFHAKQVMEFYVARIKGAYQPVVVRGDALARFELVADDWESAVYFAKRGPLIKIGFSTQPAKRLKTLELAAGVPFDRVALVEGDRAMEARYHRRFRTYRESGEWFKASGPILGEMDVIDREHWGQWREKSRQPA